jgi:hypothetical protein
MPLNIQYVYECHRELKTEVTLELSAHVSRGLIKHKQEDKTGAHGHTGTGTHGQMDTGILLDTRIYGHRTQGHMYTRTHVHMGYGLKGHRETWTNTHRDTWT